MPMRAPWICGCGHKIAGGQPCPCQRSNKIAVEKSRPSARRRGYDAQWERESKAFLAQLENRYCCCGCGKRADVVHHHKSHRGDRSLFWDRANWRPMAFACHSAHTAKHDGGFGNPTQSNRVSQKPNTLPAQPEESSGKEPFWGFA